MNALLNIIDDLKKLLAFKSIINVIKRRINCQVKNNIVFLNDTILTRYKYLFLQNEIRQILFFIEAWKRSWVENLIRIKILALS